MKSRNKALLFVGGLLFLFVAGLGIMILGAKAVTSRVPGNAVLTVELAGPIPERAPESPFGEVFGSRVLSRQDLRDALVRAASDTRIRAVRLRISEVETGFATAQEIRGLLENVAKAKKPTAAYLDTAGEFAPGNLQYYLASSCQRIVLNPLGDVNLVGLAARSPFIRGTLDKLGIDPNFPGIGDYKTARFMYTQKDFTPAHKEMMEWLIGSISDQIAAGIAAGRKMTDADVRSLIARGPYLGTEALKLKLVDELTDWSGFAEQTKKAGNETLEEVSVRRYLRSGRPDDSGSPIAVIFAEGGIVRGESGYSPMPLLGGDVMGSETIARAFRDVRDTGAKAVVFRINSPGGSAIASEIIRQEMVRTAAKIPVVVSMGDVAGSGGYWITCGAQRIVADPGTITASIGVFGGHFAMKKFWEDKLGVTFGKIDTTPNAAIFGSLDPWTKEQEVVVQKFLDRIYDNFLERVSSSRKMSRAQVDAIARGRVFTGVQAKEKGLIDVLGGFDTAVAEARKLAKLSADARVELVYYPKTKTVFQRLMERDDAETKLDATLKALLAGRMISPGPVWLPPIEVR